MSSLLILMFGQLPVLFYLPISDRFDVDSESRVQSFTQLVDYSPLIEISADAKDSLPRGVMSYSDAYSRALSERKPILVAVGTDPLRMIDIADRALKEGWIVAWEPKGFHQFGDGIHKFAPPEIRHETYLFLPTEGKSTPSIRGRWWFNRSGCGSGG